MKKSLLLAMAGLLVFWSCGDQDLKEEMPALKNQDELKVTFPEALNSSKRSGSGRLENQIAATLNASLFASTPYKVSDVHVCTLADANAIVNVETVDKQFESTLPSRWVPGDTRRNWNGDNDLKDIDWLSFTPFAIANGTYNADPIYQAMYNKWETGGFCKTVNIDRSPYDLTMGNPSLILGIGGLPPAAEPLADVSVIGFLPASIFNSIFGSPNVLGVAFSFVFTDPVTGEPTKTTRGKEDKAFTEVWFNNGFTWSNGAAPGKIDLESVILHEFGHTLNLGHFGILQRFTINGTSKLVYQPVNTMNAIYIGEPRNFLGPNDKGNFCEAWGSWPWN
ncbi:hypothetical protein [Chryseosolibacter indicus]|uniref:Peptidase M10 metallopeptidase domain-containing protein n=1 Tax=Chryseosolibacter indicus TaxID=2782351 RepID=A0ABS5VNW6_9BACT|nr:hypothetical protein [Chryseosolibacter indicus]MBT1702836.1 hypothetical protein [Chryseosolibacter indicus]